MPFASASSETSSPLTIPGAINLDNEALFDAATKLNVPLLVRWIPTPTLDSTEAPRMLSRWDGLVASPGSPYKSFTGMLRGIEFARTRDWPFAGA